MFNIILVDECKPRTGWAKCPIGFAFVKLPLGQLNVSGGNIIVDDEGTYIVGQIVPCDLDRTVNLFAKHKTKLEFIIEKADMRGSHDISVRRRDAGRRFAEDHVERLLFWINAAFHQMGDIVRALADILLVLCDRGQERHMIKRDVVFGACRSDGSGFAAPVAHEITCCFV